jgi:DNA helicase-2/ATP-dependent DNA helicase PcrA
MQNFDDHAATPAYLEGLNAEQRKAVEHHGSPLLILAGAGSGKTRVITVKIAHFIRHMRVDPHSIMAVTFTNKAANEMKERAAELSPGAREVMIRTFHSFGAWLVRRNAHLLDLNPGFTIYDDDDAVTLLRSLYPEENRGALRRTYRMISRAKDYGLEPEDDLSVISSDPEFPRRYADYEKRRREIGNLDFGDLILYPIRLLRDVPEARRRTRERFRYIFVDEYQDSNVAQYELLRLLCDAHTYVCVVGDDDQSIYRFRGAEVRNILTFHESFPETAVVRLEENYRSTNAILDVAGSVVAQNEGRLGKTLWTRRTGGRRPTLALLRDDEEEVRYCMGLIQDPPEQEARIPLGETAILYRTNAQSRLFETAFLREGIPYRIVGTLRFYEREEIKDAIAFLKLVANERDEVAFRRVVNKPPRGIGQVTVGKIIDRAGDAHDAPGNLIRACAEAGEFLGARAAKAVGAFVSVYSRIREALSGESLREFVEEIISTSGLGEYHGQRDEVAGRQRLQNLEELVNAASLYEGSSDGLVEFLETIELDSARESDEDDPDRVTLITMHNTKGLEFDRVIVTGLEEGRFPRGDEESAEEIEEERRLFYVAVTRARYALHLTSCRWRRIHGRTMELMPSRFLREIPPDLVTHAGVAGAGGDGMTAGAGGTGVGGTRGLGGGASRDAELEYPVGTPVYNDEYGAGVVVKSRIKENNEVVVVRFETGHEAQFIPKYTALERISGDF